VNTINAGSPASPTPLICHPLPSSLHNYKRMTLRVESQPSFTEVASRSKEEHLTFVWLSLRAPDPCLVLVQTIRLFFGMSSH
jgi:hypothetical protein